MERNSYMIPRILIAGANSGCGKTTVTCAILKGLVDRKFAVQSYKCGPDYIDPMLHTHITGRQCRNLDPFFLDDGELKQVFVKDAKDAEIAVIEGVMGFYDGIAMTKNASTHSVAEATKTPTIVVMNVKGMANTMIPLLKGLRDYSFGDNQIQGVILNRCTKGLYDAIKPLIEEELGLVVCGYLPVDEKVVIKSRHLGLMTAEEIGNLDEVVAELGKIASETIDFEQIMMMAKGASVLDYEEEGDQTGDSSQMMLQEQILKKDGERKEDGLDISKENVSSEKENQRVASEKKVKIAVARDKAFCFYYQENLDILEKEGATLCYFSPLVDEKLPDDVNGIYIGGGYPEAYADTLAQNKKMRKALKKAHEAKIPIIAECGGFMYVCKEIEALDGHVFPMANLIDARVTMTPKLNMQFGYVTATAKRDTDFVKAGTKIRAHEFHYSKVEGYEEKEEENFELQKASKKKWDGVYCQDNLMAGYPHWYFRNCMSMVTNFLEACKKTM